MKTRCKDKNGNYIYEGDILHVEEYPDEYVGGADLRRRRRIMNHDYAHCLDYNVDCPKECFRGQLVRDVQENHPDMLVSWMSFEGTDECVKEKNHEHANRIRNQSIRRRLQRLL